MEKALRSTFSFEDESWFISQLYLTAYLIKTALLPRIDSTTANVDLVGYARERKTRRGLFTE